MKSKTEKIKGKSDFYKNLIKDTLESIALPQKKDSNNDTAYCINGEYSRSKSSINKVFEKTRKNELPKDVDINEQEINRIKKNIRDSFLKRDVALIEILKNEIYLKHNAIRSMEEAVINAVIQYYLLQEIKDYNIEPFNSEVTEDEINKNRKSVVDSYNGYANKNGLQQMPLENSDDFVKQQILNERWRIYETSVNEAQNEILDRLVKKYNIEISKDL